MRTFESVVRYSKKHVKDNRVLLKKIKRSLTILIGRQKMHRGESEKNRLITAVIVRQKMISMRLVGIESPEIFENLILPRINGKHM